MLEFISSISIFVAIMGWVYYYVMRCGVKVLKKEVNTLRVKAASVSTLIVIAGNVKQAREWVKYNKVKNWIYVESKGRIYGLRNCMYVGIGTWYERTDIHELEMLLKSNGCVEVTPQEYLQKTKFIPLYSV